MLRITLVALTVVIAVLSGREWNRQIQAPNPLSNADLMATRGGCTKDGTGTCPTGTATCVAQAGKVECDPIYGQNELIVGWKCGTGQMGQTTKAPDYAEATTGKPCGLTLVTPVGTTYNCNTTYYCDCAAFPPGGPMCCKPTNGTPNTPRQPSTAGGDLCPTEEGCGGMGKVNSKSQYRLLASLNGLE